MTAELPDSTECRELLNRFTGRKIVDLKPSLDCFAVSLRLQA